MAELVHCVVDASVGVKLFVAEPLSDEAHALFAQLSTDPHAQLHVPDLFYIECANILWKYVQRLGYPLKAAREDLAMLRALSLRSTPTALLMAASLEIAAAQKISAYDACYVALARQLRMPLVTADQKLARALASFDVAIHWLADFVTASRKT
jgi:predicted nucleic acid-binding protein